MAVIQSDGVTAVTATSTKNNGGTAINIGTASSVLDNSSLGGSAGLGVYGSTVIDGTDTDKAISANTFAFTSRTPIAQRVNDKLKSGASDPASMRSIHKRESFKVSKVGTATRNGYWDAYLGKYVIYGSYSRSSNTVTVTAPNHGLVQDDTVRLDFTSGTATDGVFIVVTVTDSNVFTVTHGSSGSTSGNVKVVGPAGNTESPGTDEAATPTRSVPGELVYKTGKKDPVMDNYKPKTG